MHISRDKFPGLRATHRFLGLVAMTCATCGPAAAQTATQGADDAFGRRAGVEQIGLYSEGQARGFNLANSNAYRVGDAYFSRTSPLSDAIIEYVGVQLGVSAARSSVPSPTGIVSYALRSTSEARRRVSFGYRDFASPFLDLDLRSTTASGNVGVAFGALLQPAIDYPDGVAGRNMDVGGVLRADLAPGIEVTAFASVSERSFEGGYAFAPTGTVLPEVLQGRRNLGPSYARTASTWTNAGLLGAWSPTASTRIDASVIRSQREQPRADFTLLSMGDTLDTGARATLFRTPASTHVSDAVELRGEHDLRTGSTVHTFELAGRARRTDAPSARGATYGLGTVSLLDPAYGPAPGAATPVGLVGDRTRQDSVSVGYRAQIADRLELRVGGSSTVQQRVVTPLQGAPAREAGTFVSPYASAVWLPTPSLTVFGSYVEGLEDSGAAPPSAANRNEVLPPVGARQLELGLSHRWGNRLTLGGAVFDIAKPIPGLDAGNVYRFLGNVRHRGGEVTLSARPSSGTTILAGASIFDARRDDGRAPAGVSERSAFARVEHQVLPKTWVNALANYRSGQNLGGASTLRTDSSTRLDLGLRHDVVVAGKRAVLRATAVNVLDDRTWIATAGGTMIRSGPRTYRLSLTVDF